MDRVDWLKKLRAQAETLYDHLAPAYWVTFGLYANVTHLRFLEKFLERLDAQSKVLDAACGAGRYDGVLLAAGHQVLGTDQSAAMLVRACEVFPKERFPQLSYAQVGLQELDFHAEFDGAICVDAMEHVSPEDWPDILARFHRALRPGGPLYITVDLADWDEVNEAYARATALGLPVVLGEVVDPLAAAYEQTMALDWQEVSGAQSDRAVYHYYPPAEQVRTWLDQAGFALEEEATGDGYAHLLARKRPSLPARETAQ
jgi:SAM-dependent methyltransferase